MWKIQRISQQRRQGRHCLKHWSTPLLKVISTGACSDLGQRTYPERWLPHGAYYDLFTLYCAHQASASEPAASASTFYRVLSESGWKKKLKFSPPSSHSKCSICSKLKSQIQHAKGIQQQTEASDRLLRHLAGQFADRSVYHACRSIAKTTDELICLITDSMDKSKYALPRYYRGMPPKDLAAADRPSLEVTTSLVHGVGLFTYLTDENQNHGSNWVLETVNRTLQYVHEYYQPRGKPVPPTLKIWSDNTPKETWHWFECLRRIILWYEPIFFLDS